MKDSKIDIDKLFEEFNKIDDEDNIALIDFVENILTYSLISKLMMLK